MNIACPYCRKPLGLDLKFISTNPMSMCPHCETILNFSVSKDIIHEFKKITGEMEEIKSRYKGIAKFK